MLQTDFYEMSPYYQSLIQSELIRNGLQGWAFLDITPTIKQCTNTLNTNNHLGIRYYIINQQKETKPVNMKEFSRHHGLPYLLVYTNNTQSLHADQINGLNEKEFQDERAALADPVKGPDSTVSEENGGRSRRSISSTQSEDKDVNPDLVELDRKMNQIPGVGFTPWERADDFYNELTNEIESNTDAKVQRYPVLANEPLPFTTKAPNKQKRKDKNTKKSKLQLLPWPKENKKKGKKHDTAPEEVIPTNWGQPQLDRKETGCRREALRLDFEDIGWGLRIIEPKKYEAYYCTGQCGFPNSLVSCV